MKKLLLFALLTTLSSAMSQGFVFTAKEVYTTKNLSEKGSDRCQMIHSGGEGKKYLVVYGTIKSKSKEDGEINKEEIAAHAGEVAFPYVGSIDLNTLDFDDYARTIRYDDDLEWVSMVFLIQETATINSLKLGEQVVPINNIAKESKIHLPKVSGALMDKKLIDGIEEKEMYQWNVEATNYLLTYKSKVPEGKILKITVKLKMENAPEFMTIGNFYSNAFSLMNKKGVSIKCIGGGTDGSFSTNYNHNIRPHNPEGNSAEIELYFDAGLLSIEDLAENVLYFEGIKVMDLK
ncbi:MAG: hypothetical protein R2799_15290 [Crocinitomicaceae bacterium]